MRNFLGREPNNRAFLKDLGLPVDEASGSAETIIDVGGPRIRARLTLAAVEELALTEGLAVYALIKSVGLEGSV